MQKYNKNIFKEEISMNNYQSSYWMKLLNFSLLLTGLILMIGGIGCSSKPKETEVVSPYFTINGTELKADVVGIPKDSLNKDIYQAVVNTAVNFEGPVAVSPDVNQWIVDGKVIESGKNQFTYTFELPGMYQVKHCHGTDKCATRFVNVRRPIDIPEEPQVKEVVPPTNSGINHTGIKDGGKSTNGGNDQRKGEVPTPPIGPLSPPIEPPETGKKPDEKPPETFRNSVITGISSGSYRADCAVWVETAIIKLKANEFCLLHTAVIYGSGPGKVSINLSDGGDYNETMSNLLTEGKTQFAFSDLIPVLYPGKVYTLSINTLAGSNGVKPKIGNISSCKAVPKSSTAMQIDYESNDVLFDIIYKVK